MFLFWFLVAIAVPFLVTGVIVGWIGLRKWIKGRRAGCRYPDGGGWLVVAGLVLLVPLCIGITLGSYEAARQLGETACEVKAEQTGGRYVWLEYHYFGFECQLQTPSGNITSTPVWPIEDVTERG